MLIRKKYIICIAALLSFFSFSVQAVTLADVQTKLTQHVLLRGEFTQTKTMQMFNQPLVSQGYFLLAQEQGLHWQQTQPFAVSLVLIKDKLSQQFADQPAEVIAAQDNPMIFYFSHLFLSLFKGDVDQLGEQFTIEINAKQENWSLLLTPKSAPLNKVFANISIQGDEFIESIVLTELAGDSSEIVFSEQKNTPNTLTDSEKRVFQF